ncbi:ergothioneine biosynthesis protein EgtB [Argonema antarcticum A004/B2]|nr:ergothioneine biosynthesis protein EgtB [Argonema antarcticum]MCL1475222.1 ergothioneine biosynthesis protein EgtB [Argonema antarcticum A004/B2]
MQLCRAGTLAIFQGVDYNTFCHQPHPEFSPVGWHLGHIAYTESLWLLERCAGKSSLFKQYHSLFAADGLPKGKRVHLPTLPEVICYLDTVRKQVFDYLEVAPLDEQERLWRFMIQHESQHSEIISFLLQLENWSLIISQSSLVSCEEEMTTDKGQQIIEIPAGEFVMGNDSIDALDNERPAHRVYLDTYWIDRYPVTCGDYRKFMQAGGYQNPEWWSLAGWEWLQANPITQPLYWLEDSAWDNHPVCGVSWYEADAYTRFVGKRLPTEAEWEKAASWDAAAGVFCTYPWGEEEPNTHLCNYNYVQKQQTNSQIQNRTTAVNAYPAAKSAYGLEDALGNVWEWTASWFDGYEGFEYYPYRGYSQVYFDGQHRVLKGGSWATRPWALRCSFRNWYHPGVRQILAGFRCASFSP